MSHHAPFKSLSPLSWTTNISPADPSSLTDLITSTFADAQLLIDSIPTPTPPLSSNTPRSPGRARSQTDSAVGPPHVSSNAATRQGGGKDRSGDDKETVKKLSREWKDLKIPPGPSNPHGISMYKMSAKDGKGAWFARRSLHRPSPSSSSGGEGYGGFEKWEAALRREMSETLARVEAHPGKEKGTGNIRGIGAERRVDGWEGEAGRFDLYHVSARFPGPTTPRDFVTLIMMPKEERTEDDGKARNRQPRQFMIVSRPCEHPDCPPRSGFIRGTYESVEVIREVPVEKPLRRVRSSIDLSRDEVKNALSGRGDRVSKEAVLRAAKKAVGDEAESEGETSKTLPFRLGDNGSEDMEMAVEWLMVTRSDPGGSVPRFMVEKGTPGGIIGDAGKFLKWLSSQSMEDLINPRKTPGDGVGQQGTKPTGESARTELSGEIPATISEQDQLPTGETEYQQEMSPASNSGIYGLLASALGAATSAVASRVAAFAPSSKATESDVSEDESDTASEASFASAQESSASQADTALPNKTSHDHNNIIDTISATDGLSTRSAHSTFSEATSSPTLSREPTPSVQFSQAHSQHEKELRKLQQRMRKAQEKLMRAQAKRRAKHNNNNHNDGGTDGTTEADADTAAKEKQKEDEALAKLREKHAREVARQEEKYQRELQRLADKRAAEERKAEERRKKAIEREERGNLAMELERVKAERDVARKEVEMLREQVGELQGQNTMLVARLGREGIRVEEILKRKGEGK
ncbi:hypothetical protein VTI74DRAFT_7737 [Chaetomium olivicolor]